MATTIPGALSRLPPPILSYSSSRIRKTAAVAVATARMSANAEDAEGVVVVGAGAIGASIAYYLSKKGVSVTLVEQCQVACAASGKAGGFLALDWCDGSPVGRLARTSYRLHQDLAEELDGELTYGYRCVNTLSVAIAETSESSSSKSSSRSRSSSVPEWIDGPLLSSSSIGTTRTTAQVHPRLFTQTLVSHSGARVLTGKFERVEVDPQTGMVSSIVVDGSNVHARTVVLAMGPWSSQNSTIASLTSISPLKAHSIVVRPSDPQSISAHAIFLKYRTLEGKSMDPEVYPRPSGEVYLCGMSEEVELPPNPDHITPRPESIAILHRVACTVSSHLTNSEVVAEQACFLPCSEDGLPVIGKVPGVQGLYVATGHSCWGILNAPATGACMAELIVDGKSNLVDIMPFDPARFAR